VAPTLHYLSTNILKEERRRFLIKISMKMFPVSSVSGEFLNLGDRKISNMQKTSSFPDPIPYINN
jgi:hypothetical protein